MEEFKIFLDSHSIAYSTDVDLKSKTWIKTGGAAQIWVTPTTTEQLADAGAYLYKNNLQFDVVGSTSNLFFRDTYNPEIVISTLKLRGYRVEGSTAICDCGVQVSALSKEFTSLGYQGYYGLVDLPGTIAAAVYNNAGCYNCSISSQLNSIIILTEQGDTKELHSSDLEFSHRSSIFKEGRMHGIILQVIINIEYANDRDEEVSKSQSVHKRRVATQEGPAKNLGSVHAKLKKRKNIRNITTNIVAKLLGFSKKRKKRLMLSLYGYKHLDNYISDKGMNTFIWRDVNAEKLFEDYSIFINKAYKGVKREIEIKDGK